MNEMTMEDRIVKTSKLIDRLTDRVAVLEISVASSIFRPSLAQQQTAAVWPPPTSKGIGNTVHDYELTPVYKRCPHCFSFHELGPDWDNHQCLPTDIREEAIAVARRGMDDDLKVDDDASVHLNDEGNAWVQGWIYVNFDNLEEG